MPTSQRPRLLRRSLILVSALAVGASGAVLAPSAQAFSPSKTSAITISVDGTTLGVDDSVSDMSGTREGVFGGAMAPVSGSDPGDGELTELYAAKDGSFVNFTAQGGVVPISCSGSGTRYYRRAQVTVGNLPSGTNDVWVLYDPSVGPNIGEPTPQFNDTGVMMGATGTSGTAIITVSTANAATVAVGDQVVGEGLPALARITAIDLGTGDLTLDGNLTANVTGNVTVYTKRIDATSGLETLCDGTTRYVTGATGTTTTTGLLTLGSSTSTPIKTARETAGVMVDDTSASSVSFDIYVPMDGSGSGSTENFIALGIVVDAGGTGSINDSVDDAAVFTHVVSPPWFGMGMGGFYSVDLPDCSSPGASDAPCLETGATGLFAANGTTSLGSYSVSAMIGADSGEAMAQLSLQALEAQTDGFAIPSGSIAKMSVSWPTSGTFYGINFGTTDFATAAGNTGLLVDGATTSPSSATNRWDITTSSGRVITTITGEARATSTAVSRSTWYANCEVTISSGVASSSGCGEGMTSSVSTDYMVFTTVPASLGLSVSSDPVMQTIAGGMVSTNAQGMTFGGETMAGTSFEFAVAGPSYTASDASRSSDGFYYVCVPEAFLTGSFDTTPADAATSWEGTRDGAVVSTSFATGTCGLGEGLVASLDPFGYSAPLFRVKPPTASGGSTDGGSSGGSSGSTDTSTTAPSTTTPVADTTPQTPAVTPAAPTSVASSYPTTTVGKRLKATYLTKLAGLKAKKVRSVKLSVPRMYRSVCSVKKGKVVALTSGTCGVKVTYRDAKGKVRAKRVYLTVG